MSVEQDAELQDLRTKLHYANMKCVELTRSVVELKAVHAEELNFLRDQLMQLEISNARHKGFLDALMKDDPKFAEPTAQTITNRISDSTLGGYGTSNRHWWSRK